jgi:RNA polymerase sigma-70 factor (ECF subfamily)
VREGPEWPNAAGERRLVPPAALDVGSIYDSYFDFVWRVLRRLGVPAQQLEDGVQDVFVVVQRRLNDFEQRSSLKTWLFGIALRVAQEHRRHRRKRDVDVALTDEALIGSSPDPGEALLQAEAAGVVQSLLDRLAEDRRAVFVMIELEQFTAPEVAAVLGISVNAVHSRLRLARRDAEEALKRHRARSERGRP